MLTMLRGAQEDAARAARLRRVQEDYQAQDEHADGQQGNMMLALQRGELGRRKAASAGAASAAARDKDRVERQDADAEAAVRQLLCSRWRFCLTLHDKFIGSRAKVSLASCDEHCARKGIRSAVMSLTLLRATGNTSQTPSASLLVNLAA